MKKYLVWLNCKQSDYKNFYEIIHAKTAGEARESILKSKMYSDVTIIDIYTINIHKN